MTRPAAVAIGRNEGERLRQGLVSLQGQAQPVVYVDSGSTDGSVALARGLGAEVVELDMSVPFTAARARNAGYARLKELRPDARNVFFLDGDCEVVEGFLEDAGAALEADAQRAAVWGRRTERRPEASVYNKLTDLEWRLSWPYGETALFGGDVLLRTRALEEAGGYDETLIAGEEPELALRLNRAGWTIYRLDREMTRHDAAMTRFSQWWKRCVRAGHAAAEGAWRYGRGPERYGVKPSLSAWVWGAGLPAAAVLTAFLFHPAFLALFLLYPLSAYKIYRYYRRTTGASPGDCALYAAACVAAKPPQWLGQCVFLRNLVSGRRRKLIEYK